MAQTPLTPVPFDSPFTEDLIMCTSDNISIPVTAAILSLNSPFFDNLFSDSTPSESKDGLPVFRAAENCQTLCAILHLCYPTTLPVTATLEAVASGDLVPALRKYIMVNAEKRLRKLIVGSDWPKQEPLKVFAMARSYRWKNVTHIAAREVLHTRLYETPKREIAELNMITVLDYDGLLSYFRRCSDAAVAFFQPEWRGLDRYLKVDSHFPDMKQCFTIYSAPPAMKARRICQYCSECSESCLLSVSQNTQIWTHDWLSTMIVYKAQVEAKDRPRMTRDDFWRLGDLDENSWLACPSQKPSVVRELLELLERGLESAISAVELEIDEW